MKLHDVEKIIKQNESEIRAMGVKEIYIFGSVVRGEAHEKSDVDCFVVFDENAKAGFLKLAKLQLFLESKLKAPVDLGTKDSLHRQLREQILKEAIRVA